MRNWLEKIGLRIEGWMIGRYGLDELNYFLICISMLLIFVSPFVPECSYIALILSGYSIYRCYSKNIARRYQERDAYIRLAEKPLQWLRLQQRKWQDRKTYRYFTCKACGTIFRVPKGKGKIEVTCPKCRDKRIRKS